MKAVVFDRYGDADVLQFVDVERPKPRASEVLVKVFATSVNPVDWMIRKGDLRLLPVRWPRILGFDLSGVVEETGSGTRRFKQGDTVFGLLNVLKNGAYAEYVVTKEKYLAEKPPELKHPEAAALPLTGLTAFKALKKLGGLKPGDEVLIIGASGGVGTMAVQIAKAEGARVTGICSARNVSMVERLGAERVFAYDRERIPPGAAFDLIFDAVGASSYFKLGKNLTPNGRYVTTLPKAGNLLALSLVPPLFLLAHGKRSYLVLVRPNATGLEYLKKLVREKKLGPVIEREYALEEVPDAHVRSQSRRVRGKLVIRVTVPGP